MKRPRGLPPLTDQPRRLEYLATCSGTDHELSFQVVWTRRSIPDIEAFLANPQTTFEQFCLLVEVVGVITPRGPSDWVQPDGRYPMYTRRFSRTGIDPAAPGARASQWWPIRYLQTTPTLDSLRAAFPYFDDAHWQQVVEHTLTARLGDVSADWPRRVEVAADLLVLKTSQLRGRPPAAESRWPGYSDLDRTLNVHLPRYSSRDCYRAEANRDYFRPPLQDRGQVCARLDDVFWWAATRSERGVTARLRRRVRSDLRTRRLDPKPTSLLLEALTVADLVATIRPGRHCRLQPEKPAQWWDLRDLTSATLAAAPIGGNVVDAHVECDSPWHQTALVSNPYVSEQAAWAAFGHCFIGLCDGLFGVFNGDVVRELWRSLLVARGWLGSDRVLEALTWLAELVPDLCPGQVALLAVAAEGIEGLPQPPAFFKQDACQILQHCTGRLSGPVTKLVGKEVLLACIRGLADEREYVKKDTLTLEGMLVVLPDLEEEDRVVAARWGGPAQLALLTTDPTPRVR
ncbi:MAG: hypothetical protein WCP28_19085, partial [Actinomycetes bacterium]